MSRAGFHGRLTGAQSITLEESAAASYTFYAADFDNPVTADWAVNSLAPAEADASNSALTVRTFDAATAEGVGFSVLVPASATQVKLTWNYRGASSTSGTQDCAMDFYERELPTDASTLGAWSSAVALDDVVIPTTDTDWTSQTQTVALSTLGLTAGGLHQCELARKAADAGDTYTGDLVLYALQLDFS